MDVCLCLFHLSSSMVIDSLLYLFTMVSFLEFSLFAVMEMR